MSRNIEGGLSVAREKASKPEATREQEISMELSTKYGERYALQDELRRINHFTEADALQLVNQLPEGFFSRGGSWAGIGKKGDTLTERSTTPDWKNGWGGINHEKKFTLEEFAQRLAKVQSREGLEWILHEMEEAEREQVLQAIYPEGKEALTEQRAEIGKRQTELTGEIDQLWREKYGSIVDELESTEGITVSFADGLGVHFSAKVECGGDNVYWERWVFNGKEYRCEFSPESSRTGMVV